MVRSKRLSAVAQSFCLVRERMRARDNDVTMVKPSFQLMFTVKYTKSGNLCNTIILRSMVWTSQEIRLPTKCGPLVCIKRLTVSETEIAIRSLGNARPKLQHGNPCEGLLFGTFCTPPLYLPRCSKLSTCSDLASHSDMLSLPYLCGLY